jgi:single-strand DNA-binding protein
MSETFVTNTGNVTAPPRQLFGKESGQPFAVFRLAQNRVRWDRELGQRIQVGTNYVEVVAFRTLGLNAYESISKGDPVIVQGRLKVTDWTNGERQGTTVQVQAEHLGFDFAFGQGSFKKVLRPQVPGADPLDEVEPGITDEADAAGTQGPDESSASSGPEPAEEQPDTAVA